MLTLYASKLIDLYFNHNVAKQYNTKTFVEKKISLKNPTSSIDVLDVNKESDNEKQIPKKSLKNLDFSMLVVDIKEKLEDYDYKYSANKQEKFDFTKKLKKSLKKEVNAQKKLSKNDETQYEVDAKRMSILFKVETKPLTIEINEFANHLNQRFYAIKEKDLRILIENLVHQGNFSSATTFEYKKTSCFFGINRKDDEKAISINATLSDSILHINLIQKASIKNIFDTNDDSMKMCNDENSNIHRKIKITVDCNKNKKTTLNSLIESIKITDVTITGTFAS